MYTQQARIKKNTSLIVGVSKPRGTGICKMAEPYCSFLNLSYVKDGHASVPGDAQQFTYRIPVLWQILLLQLSGDQGDNYLTVIYSVH